jgi:hypothetical protein
MIGTGFRRWAATIVNNQGPKLAIGGGLATLLSALGEADGVIGRRKRNGNDKDQRGDDDRDKNDRNDKDHGKDDNVRGQGGRDERDRNDHDGDRDRDRHRDRDRDDHDSKSDRGKRGDDRDESSQADVSGGNNTDTHVFAVGDPVPGQNGFFRAPGAFDWFS